jgi:acetoin utilization protein AcuC
MTHGRARIVDPSTLTPYGMGSGHPFGKDRLVPFRALLDRLGWMPESEVLRTPPASDDELATAHERDYIAAQKALSADPIPDEALERAPLFGMGTSDNPIVPGLHAAAAAATGATLACVRAVLDGICEHAFNPAGGLHHALPAAASGFCVYNDLVVAIREARRRGLERVLYVDFDVHHGDGVERAFADDPSVMTISFHETPEVRWPGTGWVHEIGRRAATGTKLNVPLASGTGDASWLAAVEAVLVPQARRFRPDLIVSQHGCDPHREDPLADLELTTGALLEAARITHRLAHELCASRWVATGGGGYRPLHVIPRAWAMVWAVMSGRVVPEKVDPGWLAELTPRADGTLPATFLDPPCENPREAQAARINAAMLGRLTEMLGKAGGTER